MKSVKNYNASKLHCLSRFRAKDNSSRYRNIKSCYGALEGTRTPDLLVRSVSRTIPYGRLTAFYSVWRSFVGVFRRSFPFVPLFPFPLYFWSGQNCGQINLNSVKPDNDIAKNLPRIIKEKAYIKSGAICDEVQELCCNCRRMIAVLKEAELAMMLTQLIFIMDCLMNNIRNLAEEIDNDEIIEFFGWEM